MKKLPMAPLLMILAALLTAVYMSPWWNRYLGLSLDGYLPLYGRLILEGNIPYRDFFLHLPPLNPLADAAIQAVAGPRLIAFRLMGVLERMAMAALLTLWLARRFRPATALAASLIAVWLSSCCDTEVLDLYNHHSLFAALAAGFAATVAINRSPRRPWAECASGFLAGLAFWTKQTSGLGITLAIPAAWLFLALRDPDDRRAALPRLARFAFGWTLCSLPTVAWLDLHGAFSAFVQQVFLDAANSKGAPAGLLLRPWLGPFVIPALSRSARWAASAVLLAVLSLRLSKTRFSTDTQRWYPVLGIVTIALTTLCLLHGRFWELIEGRHLIKLSQFGVLLSTYGTLALAVVFAVHWVRFPGDHRGRELFLFSTVALALNATFAMSFPGDMICAMPGLALLTAVVLEAPAWQPYLSPSRWFVAVPAGAAVVAAMLVQLARPFDFVYWTEPPVTEARHRSALPALAGLHLSEPTRDTADAIVALVQRASDPGEPLFTFPVYPIFNWLADRPPATFAMLHWFDVTPDRIVDADMVRLRETMPPVIVAQGARDRFVELHERYFRGGAESGFRRMQNGLDAMLRAHYVRAGAWRASEEDPLLRVWIRTDRARARNLLPAKRKQGTTAD